MKTYNEKHNAIIHSYLTPAISTENVKNDDVIPHKTVVTRVEIHQKLNPYDDSCDKYIHTFMSRDLIIDIANQIAKMENKKINTQYSDLPF